MHDPMTVAFDIRYPWKSKNSGFRDSFVTKNHVYYSNKDRRGK